MDGNNVYGAILKCETDLKSSSTTQEQKIVALKFLVHFIGDAHQPMHVSRAEDKGGNTIPVKFDGNATNLHTLWDSRLIDHEGLSDGQLVTKLEKEITKDDPQAYQNGDLMEWLFESYTLSTTLYAEIEKNNNLDERYYTAHIDLLNERLICAVDFVWREY
jgi:hypothetical protein